MKKLAVILLVLAGASVLGATVFRESVARAAQDISATITNVDADGNVKVREQGTVHVNGTLEVPPADVGLGILLFQSHTFTRLDASLIHVTMNEACNGIDFKDGTQTTLRLFGPRTSVGGPTTITLPLTQPIRTDRYAIDDVGCGVAVSIAGTRVP